MRYIYYIIIIVVTITIAAGWGIFSETKVEFSKPAIVINDRIITETEFDDLIKSKPPYQPEDDYIDSVIIKELLIQEAIKQNINKDESFRASVEDFYEQSLVKILMDDQFKQYDPVVTDEEIDKYKNLSRMKIFISKIIYTKREDVEENKNKNIKIIESNFLDLSGHLRFTVFNLKIGESSKGIAAMEGFAVYTLVKTEQIKDKQTIQSLENNRIIEFINNGKKEALLSEWIDGLKEKAEIWRRK